MGRTLAIGVATVVVASLVTAGFYVLATLIDARFEEMSRDAPAVLGGPFYTGYYSNLVALIWHLAAAVAVFAAFVLRRAGHLRSWRLLLAGGLLTAVMASDDLFLLHESVYPAVGIPESGVLAMYGAGIAAFFIGFRRQLGNNALLIVAAVLMWVVAAGLDLTVGGANSSFVLEDGTKAVGVALWAVMLVRQAWAELHQHDHPVA